MMKRRVWIGLGLSVSVLALVRCGDSSPSQPTPAPTATPTPAPTPTPTPTPTPAPLSVVPECKLSASQAPNDGCAPATGDLRGRLEPEVNAALDRVLSERPDLFDLNDTAGGNPKVKDRQAYHTAVAAALGAQGVCASSRDEAVIVKKVNDYSEEWSIGTSSGYVRRKYLETCTPASF